MLVTTVENQKATLDPKKVEEFAGKVIVDMGACISGVLHLIGHELGLYKALEGQGYMSAKELAEKTGTFERYVKEWLNNQAAGGYVLYDPATRKYAMPDEHAAVLSAEDSSVFLSPGFFIISSLWSDRLKLTDAFKNGQGFGWHEHDHDLFFGTESFFRPGYRENLINNWLPSLDGLSERLRIGGRVADVGCGHGASTIIMAENYPNAQFYGFDYHSGSIEVAKQRAKDKNLNNVTFEQVAADSFGEGKYDLICFMDCFHDLGNPLKAAINAREKLNRTGTLMVVEPIAGDNVEENLNPIGRMFYAASTLICVPNSHSQEGDYCLGAQAGPAKTMEILSAAGFENVRVANRTPVNIIYEASL